MTDTAATEKALREALDDLWGCIGTAEIDSLQPETVALSQANHELLWHSDESLPWWAIWRRRLEAHRDA
jgi:hypothetical protein